jgi:hypothetical protein
MIIHQTRIKELEQTRTRKHTKNGFSPVHNSFNATIAFELKIKKFIKLKNKILRAEIHTSPSPVQYAREGIISLEIGR